jgi:carboxyl-terminal processing protease
VIVDVRPNAGGSEMLAREFAGCFLDKPTAYAKHTVRSGGNWSSVYDRVVEPNTKRPPYRGKVVVLMGPANMSSCESFLQMMKHVPGCKLVGDKSYGSSGNPQPIDLGNGVTAFLPSWKDLRPDGTTAEGKGIEPDVTVKTTPAELQKTDPVLAAALKLVRE